MKYHTAIYKEGEKHIPVKFAEEKRKEERKVLLYWIKHSRKLNAYVVMPDRILIPESEFRRKYRKVGKAKVYWIPSVPPAMEEIYQDSLGHKYVLWGYWIE